MTVKEAAEKWNISESIVSKYCRTGRISDAKKVNGQWDIPDDTKKPEDKRIVTGEYSKVKLPLPIGVSSYVKASTEYYYVDKTMMIKELLDEKPIVSLFTRPRRFGKTLNMDMLRVFFENTGNDTSVYFQNKKIWNYGEKYTKEQGKYPVIFITFKDSKFNTWNETLENIKDIFRVEYDRHRDILNSCSDSDKVYFEKIINKTENDVELTNAFKELSRMLHNHYSVAPIIIIDEYDTPIHQGYTKGFYEDVILFMRNLFSGGLKDNEHLSYGFLTGILRIAKESIFSGLNNIKINTILDNKYSEYFGFTKDEIETMTSYYNVNNKFEEICEWYDGYKFGKTEIFNPWSVINYFNNEFVPKAYWQSTGSNEIIGELLEKSNNDVFEKLEKLMKGEKVTSAIDSDVIYPQIKEKSTSIFSFLLLAGYLNTDNNIVSSDGGYIGELYIPNKEILYVYNREIISKMQSSVSESLISSIKEALVTKNEEVLKRKLQDFLLESVSFWDTTNEIFYHGLILGICSLFNEEYYIRSNRESGEGRYDIMLMPKNNQNVGVIIELKSVNKNENLKDVASKALDQIIEKKYTTELESLGISTILKYGVAFCKKNVEVTVL